MSDPSLPFVDPAYVRSYASTILLAPGFPFPLVRRNITGTTFHDGQFPWPYVCVDPAIIASVHQSFPDLVSAVGVLLSPLECEIPSNGEIQPFKNHFVFDPSLPQKELSRKSRSNLAKGSRRWRFRISNHAADWRELRVLYQFLVDRRRLAGGSFDFPEAHFENLGGLPYMKVFGVHDSHDWGAMVCAAQFGRDIHLIHMVARPEGLESNATYVMMQSLLNLAVEQGSRVFMGGVPAGDDGGVLKFKSRWSNRTAATWLVKQVIRPDVYERLAIPGNSFFPAYRRNW